MSLEKDIFEVLGAISLESAGLSRRQPTTRLDYTGTKRRKAFITQTKIIRSGTMAELYHFEKPIAIGLQPRLINSSRVRKQSEEHRARSIIRAINNVRRLIHLNFTEKDKFLTLTFNNDQPFDVNDLSSCLPFYQNFMRKLRYKYKNLKYITVPEFQKRGAVHYHILCNLPFIRKSELNKLWTHGFSKPKAIQGTTHLALYLCKYLSKKFDDRRKEGHKLYYTSQKLLKPVIEYGSQNTNFASKLVKTHTVQYRSKYTTERNGTTHYIQFIKKS